MWGDMFGDASEFGVFGEDAFDGTGGETPVIAGVICSAGVAGIVDE